MAIVINSNLIPVELRELDQWVCWQDRGGRKVPIDARTQQPAKSNDHTTWCDFQTACDALAVNGNLSGLGFVFSDSDGLVGIDLDECIDDRGKIAEWALAILCPFDSYAEISPSGRGLKIWCYGDIERGRKKIIEERAEGKSPGIEVYTAGRYFTVTGQCWEGLSDSSIKPCQPQIDRLHKKHFSEPEPPKLEPNTGTSPAPSSGQLTVQERAARYLAKLPPAVSGQHGHDSTYHAACVLMLGFAMSADDAWPVFCDWNASCEPPWNEKDLRRKLEEANKVGGQRGWLLTGDRYQGDDPNLAALFQSFDAPAGQSEVPLTLLDLPPDAEDDWPEPVEKDALYGLAGEFVEAVLPETEADEAALLIHFLTFASAMMGRERSHLIGGTEHHARLFSVCVGETATGRKGTALDCVLYVFRMVDAVEASESQSGNLESVLLGNGFCEDNIAKGLVSGAGLIWQVRDPRDVGNKSDPGVDDKRLLVIESELGGVLRVCQRKENDLSAVIRDAWDGGTLRTLAKQEPAKATRPHVNIIGHVTREELRATLSRVDVANGFANRILWYCSRRSKLLPNGGALHSRDLSDLARRIRAAVNSARKPGRIDRTPAAARLWTEIYHEQAKPRFGVYGNVTTRAVPQILRLSMVYALLDEADTIDISHLQAARAVWSYCEASARWAFGASLGNQTADELLLALRQVKPGGMSSTDISALFNRNRTAAQLREACGLLQRYGLARSEKAGRPGPGRQPLIWYAT